MKAKPMRRWLRYSVRTLLVIVTVLCIWLGRHTYLVRQQRILVQEVLRLGGFVRYAHEFPNDRLDEKAQPLAPVWLRHWLGDDFFTTVIWVVVHRTKADDELLKLLNGAPELRVLWAHESNITDKGLKQLYHAQELVNISLGPNITDASLQELTALPQLTTVQIDSTNVTNAGLETNSTLTELEVLGLRRTQVDKQGLKTAFARLKNLNTLRVVQTNLTSDALEEEVRELPSLVLLQTDAPMVVDPITQKIQGTAVFVKPLPPSNW